MSSYSLVDISTQTLAIGKAAIFVSTSPYVYAVSPGGADLTLTHVGFTEGPVVPEANDSYDGLQLKEQTGDAYHNRKLSGENPVVTIPMLVSDKTLRAILSPTNSIHGGYSGPRAVTEHTLVLVPEALFIVANAPVALAATNTAGTIAWTVGGVAASAAQLALLDLSMWFWRGHFEKVLPSFIYEGGGKDVKQVKFQGMYQSAMPDGHRLYTCGRPELASTPILIDAV